mmetsp:Transcript_34745/g.98468  ORF Transcript_34745/g.98468 Transcript_34745/m.98468 type:complete len:220 (-) Transcript_34745:2540-3199(-)
MGSRGSSKWRLAAGFLDRTRRWYACAAARRRGVSRRHPMHSASTVKLKRLRRPRGTVHTSGGSGLGSSRTLLPNAASMLLKTCISSDLVSSKSLRGPLSTGRRRCFTSDCGHCDEAPACPPAAPRPPPSLRRLGTEITSTSTAWAPWSGRARTPTYCLVPLPPSEEGWALRAELPVDGSGRGARERRESSRPALWRARSISRAALALAAHAGALSWPMV